MSQTSTKVRVDELNLLIQGVRRSLSLYDGRLEVKFEDDYLQIGDIDSGEICQIKLSDNVNIKED